MIFSHESIRPGQKEMMDAVACALNEKKHVLAHAPTGLGKTAAVLFPAIKLAIERDLVVFFLTSRHTQHSIVLETAKMLIERNNVNIPVASLIGKKGMCAQDNIENLPSSDFADYCKMLVENKLCEFYENARGSKNFTARKVLEEFRSGLPLPAEKVISDCVKNRLCPYELSLMLCEEAKLIIADYYYIFHPNIRDSLFSKIKKKLEQAIIIVDEGHNLPERCRNLLTFRLSNNTLRLAVKEAKEYGLEIIPLLSGIQDVLNKMSKGLKEERLVQKNEFISPLSDIRQFDEIVNDLEIAAGVVKAKKNQSYIGSVAKFLKEWVLPGEGFARILSREDMLITLTNRCLDPSFLTKNVFDNCYSSVVMSGTLNPVSMYSDILGFDNPVSLSFKNPFPEGNRLVLIVPKTTTKFTMRSENQYREIASLCADLANRIPGCVMIFFPSYSVRDSVAGFFSELYNQKVFYEKPGMEKSQKQLLLDAFSSCSRIGAVLLAAASGSFGEGIDLPGILKGVIVVGLPLDKPDLETTQLISYYDSKFGKGWEYGYILPAITRCIQNAGRCIRSEKDRGVLVFVDERYAWPRYRYCFPPDWKMKITPDYKEDIAGFFGKLV